MADATHEHLLTLIREAKQEAGEAAGTITSTELADTMDCTSEKARSVLRELREAGKVQPDYVRRVNSWGEVQSVKGYRIVE